MTIKEERKILRFVIFIILVQTWLKFDDKKIVSLQIFFKVYVIVPWIKWHHCMLWYREWIQFNTGHP